MKAEISSSLPREPAGFVNWPWRPRAERIAASSAFGVVLTRTRRSSKGRGADMDCFLSGAATPMGENGGSHTGPLLPEGAPGHRIRQRGCGPNCSIGGDSYIAWANLILKLGSKS